MPTNVICTTHHLPKKMTRRSPTLNPKTRPHNNQQQKTKIWKIVDFAVPADHRIKLKECEKRNKYSDLDRELKKLWNMRMTTVPIVTGAFGMVTKGLLKLAAERRPSKQQHYWKWPEYWEESWRLEETCCHSDFREKPSAIVDVKSSNKWIIIMWKSNVSVMGSKR